MDFVLVAIGLGYLQAGSNMLQRDLGGRVRAPASHRRRAALASHQAGEAVSGSVAAPNIGVLRSGMGLYRHDLSRSAARGEIVRGDAHHASADRARALWASAGGHARRKELKRRRRNSIPNQTTARTSVMLAGRREPKLRKHRHAASRAQLQPLGGHEDSPARTIFI